MGTSVKIDTSNLATQASVNAIPTNPQRRPSLHSQNCSAPGMAVTNLVSVTGKGKLLGIMCTNAQQINITVIIDGTTIFNALSMTGSGEIATPYGNITSTPANGALIGLLNFEFQSSLLVRADDGVLTNASSAQILWETE